MSHFLWGRKKPPEPKDVIDLNYLVRREFFPKYIRYTPHYRIFHAQKSENKDFSKS
jgi:hypothetical protein